MNDFLQKYKTYIIAGILFIAICTIGWAMFGGISSDGGTADNAGKQLENVAEQQRAAKQSLDAIAAGIVDSQRSVGQLESANNRAKTAAGNIESANNSIKNAIGNAQESNTKSTELIADSQRRISESIGILQAIRETKQDVKN